MNATCPQRDVLEAYLLGEVDNEAVDTHLDLCADCRATLEQLDANVNQPFMCLRAPIDAATIVQEPVYRQMVAQAKAIGADLTLPYTLGNYRLLERIANSGMGRVYKAQHLLLQKTVAVKLIAPWLIPTPDGRERFQREMQAVGKLASPHIVTAFDAGVIDGRDYLVMEFIEGKDLEQLVKREGPLPVDRALDCILQAARGLADAHAAGIIHRDVKPSNLLLDVSGTVKVLDLGLARLRGEEPGHERAVMGTVAYMAPEQALDSHNVDERADIYSLGCTLHYLLTGKSTYTGITPMEVFNAHRDQPIPLLNPPHVNALFRRMVAKNPADRPASMQAVIAALERLQTPTIFSRFVWRIAVAACLLFVVGSLFAFWNSGGDLKKDAPAGAVAQPKKGATPAIDMVRVAAGKFWMGASDSDPLAQKAEKPRREIKINRAFLLSKHEVTQAEYEEVMGTNPSAFSKKGQFKVRVKDLDTSKHPVESVSWLDAVRFCNRLSERHELEPYYQIKDDVVTIKGGVGYRLPTEAEWEYACRAGTTTTWSFGEKGADLKEHAWFDANSGDRTHPVATKKANPFGLYDMYGNVPEWCWDRYDEAYYDRMPSSDPPGSGTGRYRVFRGDAWNSPLPRTSSRQGLGFAYGSAGSINIIGIRLARNSE